MPFENVLNDCAEYKEVLYSIEKNIVPLNVISGSTAQRAHFIYSVFKEKNENILAVCPSESEARSLFGDLAFFAGENAVFFSQKDYVFYDADSVSRSECAQRIKVCADICKNEKKYIIVASVESVMQFCIKPEIMKKNNIEFVLGKEFDIEELALNLITMGYKRNDMVEGIGQFSVRGGIIDIFSPNYTHPLRIEFFDTETDSIRFFDAEKQTTIEKINAAYVCPCREIIYYPNEKEQVVKELKNELIKLKRKKTDVQTAIENLSADIEKFEEKYYFASTDKYVGFIYPQLPTILDFLDENAIVFVDEEKRCYENAKDFEENFYEGVSELISRGTICASNKNFLIKSSEIFTQLEKFKIIALSSVFYSGAHIKFKNSITFNVQSLNSFHGKIEFLYDDLRDWKTKNSTVVLLAGGSARCESLTTSLNNADIECVFAKHWQESCRGRINVMTGSLTGGFYYPKENFVIISDREIFKENKRRKKQKNDDENKIHSFTDISPGDYVVHQVHGIGKYEGIQKLTTLGATKDYLKISYHGTDKLYVPVTQIDMLYKYIGSTDRKVSVNKLGGADWNRTKARVKASTQDLAKYLIELYSVREKTKGFAFSKDTPWQRQFEDTFAYTETEDQLKCIEEVKRDMESERPMDRLLCGDVGYGKTEVAMRAAFKAVMDSKQVAYLVPTTVLAMQHFSNFSQRMKDFPIRCEMLSRFKSAKEQKEILKKLKTGEIDIIIGTHRILQKDLEFKDLGLLIIDEEQRFGVGHKEKLKELKKNIDVLTLTATPIPRTLHMAMVNIRDMSVITQPPENRYPVQTYVMDHNEAVIADAIRKEIGRGGQVYYLYNKVKGIYSVAQKISELVKDAKVGVGHGQMSEGALEDVMVDMVNGDINVLVCTTIIETGLDISNVNTIIIENADHMGLAQLYQLRGRVGRSNKMAYAYLTYRRDKSLSEIAQKRLSAIREFTEFGSGFKIAMRDLQIRGAGNILGSQQHGHMDAVGYDMYCRILKESVDELSDNVCEEKINTSVDLNISAYIPENYILNSQQRIDAYKKISSIETIDDCYDVQEEFVDRYGDLPVEVNNVIDIAYIKSEAQQAGISEITQKEDNVVLKFAQGKTDMEKIALAVSEYKNQLLFSAGEICYLTFRQKKANSKQIIHNVKNLLHLIK